MGLSVGGDRNSGGPAGVRGTPAVAIIAWLAADEGRGLSMSPYGQELIVTGKPPALRG